MRILYLCPKGVYDTKMSRVRFHSMAAIAKIADVDYWGRGWPQYNKTGTATENLTQRYGNSMPDLVVAYKPLGLRDFKSIPLPKCVRYNEMWDKRKTANEICKSGAGLVICHHKNDMPYYEKSISGVRFVNISHCAEKRIYRDYGLPKEIDVLFTGAVSRHYPFRARLLHIVRTRLSGLVKCYIMPHPGDPGVPFKEIAGCTLKRYAKTINRSKITFTCSSRYKYRLGKYTEIPLCASLLAADLPDEDQDFFRKFMLVLNPLESDDEIVKKVLHYVRNDKERNALVQKGIELNKGYTQEKYAERFVQAAEEYIRDFRNNAGLQ